MPPTVATPALSNVLDRSKDFVDRVHGLASGAVPEVKNQKDLATLAKQLSDPKEDKVVRNEIVNLFFRSNYPELEGVLLKILENPDEGQDFRAWAVQHIGDLLTNPGDIPVSPDLAGRVRSLLSDSDLHVRREALLALSSANDTQMLQELPAMLKSQAPGSDRMRDLAIRIARQKDLRDQIPFIRTLIAATNESVRIAAIVALSEWRDQESRPAIESALKEGSMGVKRAAAAALQRLDTPPKKARE
ncbi:MAG: HEAT repeat domain-containing protein [Kiritimatiellia bacterium]